MTRIIALLLGAAKLPTYAARVRFMAVAALAAVLLIDCGDAVWWQIPWTWKVHQVLYDFTAWLIAGLVLADFVRREAPASN